MTSDDQHFLDTLSGVSSDIRKFAGSIIDETEAHIDSIAAQIRNTLGDSSWFPQSARPPPPPPPKTLSLLTRSQLWMSKNKAITAAVIAFVSTGAVVYYYQRRQRRKQRRAKRAQNGARKEVVVVAGPIASPYTKSIALDLERRGFIVYVVVHSVEEEQEVHKESRTDIRPLNLELVEPLTSAHAIERFYALLTSPHHAFAGAEPHRLQFTGLVVVPDLIYPPGPIQAIETGAWSDAINSKILGTIATMQAFLPAVIDQQARVLMLTPTITNSLQPQFHGVESTVVGALEGFTTTLKREMSTLGVRVMHLKLASFDCSKVGERNSVRASHNHVNSLLLGPLRSTYGANYLASSSRGAQLGLYPEAGSTARGSSLRHLNHAVFDCLTGRQRGSLVRVGKGSLGAELVGKLMPASLVDWMLGIQRIQTRQTSPELPLHSQVDTPPSSLEDSTLAWEKVEDERPPR